MSHRIQTVLPIELPTLVHFLLSGFAPHRCWLTRRLRGTPAGAPRVRAIITRGVHHVLTTGITVIGVCLPLTAIIRAVERGGREGGGVVKVD